MRAFASGRRRVRKNTFIIKSFFDKPAYETNDEGEVIIEEFLIRG